MAVTREQLAQYVGELGLDTETSNSLTEKLLGNQTAATQFVGQRLRHDDYTRKAQETASQRTQIEQQANQQIQQYAQQLAAAQDKINTIVVDFEKSEISTATANARLKAVKEKYNLSDDDIPTASGSGVKPPENKQGDIDIDAKLKTFGEGLMRTIREDMLAMPRVSEVQSFIRDEHKELTGKRLTREEMNDLLVEATKNKTTLESAWENKYKISDARQTKRDTDNKTKWQQEWEAEQRQKNSEAAMAGVRQSADGKFDAQSPVLRKEFKLSEDPYSNGGGSSTTTTTTNTGNGNNGGTPSTPAPKMSGAERAAVRFMERRNNGIPMGQPDPVGKTA